MGPDQKSGNSLGTRKVVALYGTSSIIGFRGVYVDTFGMKKKEKQVNELLESYIEREFVGTPPQRKFTALTLFAIFILVAWIVWLFW